MELRIEGTHQEQAAVMKQAIIDLWGSVKGYGKQGLEADVVTASRRLDRIDTNLSRRLDRIDTAFNTSIFWGKVVAGILTLFFAGAVAYFTSLEIRGKAKSIVPPPIGQTTKNPAYAMRNQTQDAGINPATERRF